MILSANSKAAIARRQEEEHLKRAKIEEWAEKIPLLPG